MLPLPQSSPAPTDDSLDPTMPQQGGNQHSDSLPSAAPWTSPSTSSAKTISAAPGAAAANCAAATAPYRPDVTTIQPAPQQQPLAAAPAAMAAAAAAPAAPAGAAAGGHVSGAGGSGPTQLLPAPEELEQLLAAPAGEVELLPLAEQLLEVAEWAGVDAAQVSGRDIEHMGWALAIPVGMRAKLAWLWQSRGADAS